MCSLLIRFIDIYRNNYSKNPIKALSYNEEQEAHDTVIISKNSRYVRNLQDLISLC